ncbi:MAG: hypothetical protein RLZZ151_966, partial [Pseudomonadota bacterium]
LSKISTEDQALIQLHAKKILDDIESI